MSRCTPTIATVPKLSQIGEAVKTHGASLFSANLRYHSWHPATTRSGEQVASKEPSLTVYVPGWNMGHLPHAFTVDDIPETRVWIEQRLEAALQRSGTTLMRRNE